MQGRLSASANTMPPGKRPESYVRVRGPRRLKKKRAVDNRPYIPVLSIEHPVYKPPVDKCAIG